MSTEPQPTDSLAARAAAFGVALGPEQQQALTRYRDEIVSWNRSTNLTGVGLRDPAAIDETLVLESLRLVPMVAPSSLPSPLVAEGQGEGGRAPFPNSPLPTGAPSAPVRLIDVGSGAGVPGIPLKVALGDGLDAVLLDSNGKKARFLRRAVEVLGRPVAGTRVVHARAEDAGQAAEHRETYDVAVARAVGSLRVLAELCLPLVRIGGRVLLPRGRDHEREAADAVHVIEAVGGRLLPAGGDRAVVVIEKSAPTPARFPRRVGVPRKRPL